MREQFEKLRVIAVLLSFRSAIHWNEKRGRYESHDNKDEYDCMYLNGAWYAYQEQQAKAQMARDEKTYAINRWTAVCKERDDLKAQLECCRKENAVLLGRVGELQSQLKAVYALSRMRASVISSWKREELSIKVRKAISYLAKKEKALRGANDSFTEARQKAEDQINNGARLTKHQIDLRGKHD